MRARCQFFLDSNVVPLNLNRRRPSPADIDGHAAAARHGRSIVDHADDGSGYGGRSMRCNVWDLFIKWNATPEASLTLAAPAARGLVRLGLPCGPSRG